MFCLNLCDFIQVKQSALPVLSLYNIDERGKHIAGFLLCIAQTYVPVCPSSIFDN